MAGHQVHVIVAVAFRVGELAGSLFAGGSKQLQGFVGKDRFDKRQSLRFAGLSFQPGFEAGREVELRIVRNKAASPDIASRRIGCHAQQLFVPFLYQLKDGRMIVRGTRQTDSGIGNDLDAMSAGADPAGHRIDGLTCEVQ